MAKYQIKVDEYSAGICYLDALNYVFYLFLKPEYMRKIGLDDDSLTHIQENYKGRITEHVTLTDTYITTKYGKVIVRGWALCLSGNHKGYHDTPAWHFILKALEEKASEVRQTAREYETIIVLERLNRDSQLGYGGSYFNHGFMHIGYKYEILRRCVKDNKRGENALTSTDYAYYKIPRDKENDYLTYIPKLQDEVHTVYEGYNSQILTYTPEKHQILENMCGVIKQVGENIDALFEKNMALAVKLNEHATVKMLELLPQEKNDE